MPTQYPMKSVYLFLTLVLLPFGLSMAQTTPTSTTLTSKTKPASTTITSTSSNRQQELYDEYHGITKKSTATPAATKPTTYTEKPASPAQPTASASQSQRMYTMNNASGIRIGVRGGVTYPAFLETKGVDPALGFVGGITLNLGAGHVSFQPELNYTRYNTKQKLTGFTSTNAFDVLEVPLFLKIASGTYAGNRFFLNIGPYAAYRMSASQDGQKVSLEGTTGRFGFGAGAGIGAAIKAGPGHFTIEARGLYSLGDTDSGFSTDSKTIYAQGTLGYIFPLGGR